MTEKPLRVRTARKSAGKELGKSAGKPLSATGKSAGTGKTPAAVLAPTASSRRSSRTYKRRPGAAPRWPEKRYRWGFLQDAMIRRKMTPADLAGALNHHPGLVYEWLSCEHIPRPASFARIAGVLFVDTQELLGSFPVGD